MAVGERAYWAPSGSLGPQGVAVATDAADTFQIDLTGGDSAWDAFRDEIEHVAAPFTTAPGPRVPVRIDLPSKGEADRFDDAIALLSGDHLTEAWARSALHRATLVIALNE